MKHISKILTISTILLLAPMVWASQWQIDPDHTEVRFEINHILTTVSGQFTQFEGDIFFNPDKPETGKLNFIVKVISVDTNNGKRDTHLRSKDFFEADKYPEMRFTSTKISKLSHSTFALEGMMTIKDVSKKIQTQFKFISPKPHPFAKGKKVGGFVTQFTIPRLDYHVGTGKFLKMGVVGSDVLVEISMEALTNE